MIDGIRLCKQKKYREALESLLAHEPAEDETAVLSYYKGQ